MKAELLAHMGDDLMVVNAARVSFNKYHETFEATDENLIKYLAKHAHWAPFAHPQIQFRITAPIFIARQCFRHTVGVVRNEVSRRYVDTPPEFFFPDSWRGRPPESIKQGSSDEMIDEQDYAYEALENVISASTYAYDELLKKGVAPEQARMVLPQNTYTIWIETGSLYYWSRFCNLRLERHAQQEIRTLALDISKKIGLLFPVSWEYLVPWRSNLEK